MCLLARALPNGGIELLLRRCHCFSRRHLSQLCSSASLQPRICVTNFHYQCIVACRERNGLASSRGLFRSRAREAFVKARERSASTLSAAIFPS